MAKVTQKMIARKLGISATSVACGLGLYGGKTVNLSEEKRQLIIKTAQEMGYRPNQFAQYMAGRKTGVIGVISFGGISQMAAQRSREIAYAIRNAGYDILIHEVAWYSRENVERVVYSVLDNHVEALILIEPTDWFDFSLLQQCYKNAIPVVSMGGELAKGLASIVVDEYRGVFDLTTGLIKRGSRHLGFLGADAKGSFTIRQREKGFVDALEKSGGKVVPSAMHKKGKSRLIGEILRASPTMDWNDPYLPGYEAMEWVLKNERLPDTLICINDDWALGVLKRCREVGIHVPQDMKITGNDGTIVAAYGETPLTTIIQPLKEMSTATVALALKMLKEETFGKSSVVQKIRPRVEWRLSTGIEKR